MDTNDISPPLSSSIHTLCCLAFTYLTKEKMRYSVSNIFSTHWQTSCHRIDFFVCQLLMTFSIWRQEAKSVNSVSKITAIIRKGIWNEFWLTVAHNFFQRDEIFGRDDPPPGPLFFLGSSYQNNKKGKEARRIFASYLVVLGAVPSTFMAYFLSRNFP